MAKKRDESAPFWMQMREAERSIITFAIECAGTLRKAAEGLGISPNYLSERARDLGIEVPDSRPGPKPGTKRAKLDQTAGDGEIGPSEDDGYSDMPNANGELGVDDEDAEDDTEDVEDDEGEDEDEDEDELDIQVGEDASNG